MKAAQALILERGYGAVTVDDITAAVGVSKRSFFRYFASKDDVILGRYDLFGDQLVEALDARPAEENIWVSLRRMFDPVIALTEDDARRAGSRAIQRIVVATPVLHAGYLERFDRMQERVAKRVTRHLEGQDREMDQVRVRALVGSAFACLHAATNRPIGRDDYSTPGSALDAAMDTLRPMDPRLRD